ncbi:chemotaxis protein CheA [Novosphingobium sp. AP12]|uniref:chemotaxis protein CheA n=1 Tax=Novosphingobium sp. AP12 TaxID=1144305 RepID=UPI000271FB5F|nr:chemotaxis protein CheA [Novosphingobium sp. AP12]EJL26225.1 chemotaxis protein histidine kinase-like protein [Novosphingobium sp. AP12]
MDELLEQFLIEGRELVAEASKDLSALARDPQAAEALDGAFRAIHTLKGSFAVFALAPAEKLLHAAEDVLDRARRQASLLDAAAVAGLVACLDQTDRWIDDVERSGALPTAAEEMADRAIALLAASAHAVAAGMMTGTAAHTDWLAALTARETGAIAQAAAPLTAFRYTPDADCFFRGEDPLGVVERVPALIALAVLPTGGAWPAIADMEPFACFSIIEGLSGASEAEVRAAFRLQPSQITLATVEPRPVPQDSGEAVRDKAILRVDAARIDALADGLGDLIVAINGLAPLADEVGSVNRALAARLRAAQADIERATGTLSRNLTRVRLVPLETTLRRLPRVARQIAQGLGKEIAFTLVGETIEVDKQVADGLFEPLLHIVRNAIDHGVEPPEVRRQKGKDAKGQVTLTFQRQGDAITSTVSDDGAGIDPARLRASAVERGLLSQEGADALDDAAALRLIFRAGFSTASSVTEISGRGVGMDAVQAAIARLRGSVEIESRPGAGTRFRIRLPVTALTTRLLVIEVAGERYGVSLEQVAETVRIDEAALMPVGRGLACVLRDRTIPVLDLAVLLNAPPARGRHAKLVVTYVDGNPVALRVDGFGERIDTVLRPPRGILAAAPGVIGSAVLGDGGVLLVLDLPELAA